MTEELRTKLRQAISPLVGGIHAINVVKAIEPILDEHVAEQRREAFAEGEDLGYNEGSER